MKVSSLLVLLTLSTGALAGGDPCRDSQEVQDVFGCETNEFSFERFDDSTIMLAINRDASIACDSAGLCRISSVTSNDRRFTATFSVGEGSMMGGASGTGTNIIIPGTGTDLNQTNPYYGITLKYTTGRCTQTVNVPRAVYYAVNRYMYGLMTETGGTRRGFTPADEAMIMFYTTLMKQATGCVAGQ